MAAYKLSRVAKIDISDLYEYGIAHFGLHQAQRYVLEMHDYFQKLAENHYLGRDASEFQEGLSLFSFKAHTIFYIKKDNDILIIRILGNRMDYGQHLGV